ncbi:unnamed protein product [Ranitomeya imitator]|uniref:Thyroglobulin type-1 domain-containing protein n=1 Tax=Ranitomeya imitator TaxID=111125 RepID=A0ABN9KZQ7_9NEOB|nr:unnamed protein product [Ranitomeya imitator]
MLRFFFYTHIDPPCQTEFNNIQKQQGLKKLLGYYIPACDEDGYYKSAQCHGSVGADSETSGDFGSGDFHDWSDDEDDEEMMNDEDEIDDDDEDEGGDDEDEEDEDGYI